MYKVDVILKNETGLHARPASLFVREANNYKSIIRLIKDSKEYNGKSIMSVLSMAACKDTKITIIAEGEDELESVNALKNLLNSINE
jgi:phosphocarrier protein